MEGANVVSYIGWTTYDSGEKTAKKLVEYAGDTARSSSWATGAPNTDAKLKALKTNLAAKHHLGSHCQARRQKPLPKPPSNRPRPRSTTMRDMTAIVGSTQLRRGIGSGLEELGKAPAPSPRSCMTRSDHP